MNEHKQFEILCALVVVGQVSDADLRELKQHVVGCVDCQKSISDFAQISAQALPLSGENYSKPSPPKKMTARFIERARAEGIPLRESNQVVPSLLSFGSLSWKGSLAAALLLVAIIAGGISKSGHSRAQSAETAKAAKLELPNQRSIQTEIPQSQSTPQRAKLLPAPRRTRMSNARLVESAGTPTRQSSEHESGSLSLGQVFPDIQYSANHFQGKTAINSQLFSSDVKSEPPRLFQVFDGRSGRPWLVAPSRMSFTHRNQLVNAADHVSADSRERAATFATMAVNLPLHVFGVGSDRPPLSDSPRTQSELNLNIDWHQVRLTLRTESLRNSNDPSPYRPGVMLPGWPLFKGAQGEQQ